MQCSETRNLRTWAQLFNMLCEEARYCSYTTCATTKNQKQFFPVRPDLLQRKKKQKKLAMLHANAIKETERNRKMHNLQDVRYIKLINSLFYYLLQRCFSPFVSNTPFPQPLKTSENRAVFQCFQGVKKGCIATEWVKYISIKV